MIFDAQNQGRAYLHIDTVMTHSNTYRLTINQNLTWNDQTGVIY